VDLSFSEQLLRMVPNKVTKTSQDPSSIYSWSICQILEHEFCCLGSQGSKDKKVDLRNSEQLLRVVFLTFGGQNKCF